VEVPMSTVPLPLVPRIAKDGEEEPVLPTQKEKFSVFCSIARVAEGEVVPIPTLPPLLMRKYVADDEPTVSIGEVPSPGPVSMDSSPHGVEVPIPTFTDMPCVEPPRMVNCAAFEEVAKVPAVVVPI